MVKKIKKVSPLKKKASTNPRTKKKDETEEQRLRRLRRLRRLGGKK